MEVNGNAGGNRVDFLQNYGTGCVAGEGASDGKA